MTGISQLENVYAQNARTVKEYLEHIDQGAPLVVKGYTLTDTEKIIRQIINEIMCNQYLSWTRIGAAFNQKPEDIKASYNFV